MCRGFTRANTGLIGVAMSIYTENGFENRKDYLLDLADTMGLDPSIVFTMADLLGPSEDFDGLVTSLEDYVMGY